MRPSLWPGDSRSPAVEDEWETKMRAVFFSLVLLAAGTPAVAQQAGEEEPFIPLPPTTTYPDAKPAPGQSSVAERPCDCGIPQGACTARVQVTDVGRRRDNVGADIAYIIELSSTDKRCSNVNYRLRLTSPDGRTAEQAYEAIFDNGAYQAGGMIRSDIGPDARVTPSGVTCFVCSPN